MLSLSLSLFFLSSLHCPETIPAPLFPTAEWIIFTDLSSSDTRSAPTRRQTLWEELSPTVSHTLHTKCKLVQFCWTACQLYAIEHSSVWQLLKILQGSIQTRNPPMWLSSLGVRVHHCRLGRCWEEGTRECFIVRWVIHSSLILPASHHRLRSTLGLMLNGRTPSSFVSLINSSLPH